MLLKVWLWAGREYCDCYLSLDIDHCHLHRPSGPPSYSNLLPACLLALPLSLMTRQRMQDDTFYWNKCLNSSQLRVTVCGYNELQLLFPFYTLFVSSRLPKVLFSNNTSVEHWGDDWIGKIYLVCCSWHLAESIEHQSLRISREMLVDKFWGIWVVVRRMLLSVMSVLVKNKEGRRQKNDKLRQVSIMQMKNTRK